MAIIHERPGMRSRLVWLLTSDFCPGFNRYLYWLKEPIGWFVLALATSAIVGRYVSPVGWTLAASLSAIIVVGMVWPLIAVRGIVCRLQPETDAVHEDAACRMIVSIRNRLPLPVWGLAIEGYLDCHGDEAMPNFGLACLPPLCIAEYSLTVRPPLRGRYPMNAPKVACAFPFGIWTARRGLAVQRSLTVWPKVYPINGTCSLVGVANADQGDGQRGGRCGDIIGVRGFRRGDSPRHIHWAASARTDTLIVAERGGPQTVEVEVFVDTQPAPVNGFQEGINTRAALADRVRVAASVLVKLHALATPMRIMLGDRVVRCSAGMNGRRQILDALAEIPADGNAPENSQRAKPPKAARAGDGKRVRIEIRSCDHDANVVIVAISDPHGGKRAGGARYEWRSDPDKPLEEQVRSLWQEVGHVTYAA